MGPSWFKLLLVVFLFMALFGRGKISEMMGDVAKGIKSFKRGMSDDEDAPDADRKAIGDRATDQIDAKAATPENAQRA